jgi:hypothetical protein
MDKENIMSSERKKLVKKLDTIFSYYIRARDKKSVFSGKTENLQCFHIFSRISYSTRWDEKNAFASTATENLIYEHDTHFQKKVHDWYIANFGDNQFDLMYYKWNHTTKFSDNDLKELIKYYANKLREVTKC